VCGKYAESGSSGAQEMGYNARKMGCD
jgi:hypothetical protein